MTIYRRALGGDPVKINALPSSTPMAEQLWNRWLAHVENNEAGVVGLDVESSAIDEVLGCFDPAMELRTVQFGSRRYAWVLDAHDDFWRPKIEALLNRTRPDNPFGFRFVSHSNYDPLWAHREFGTEVDERFIDTLTMAALLYPGREPKDLKSLSNRHLGPELVEAEVAMLARFAELAPRFPTPSGKQLRKPVGKALRQWGFTNTPLSDEAFSVYAGLDAIAVRRLLDVLSAMVKRARGLAPLSRREQKITRICTNVRIRGQRVDGDWARELLAEVEAEYGAADARLVELFGFSPRSPKVGTWLEAHGAEFDKRTETGRPQITMPSASSDGTLPQLAERYEADAELGPVFGDLLTLGMHKNLVTNLRIITAAAANDGFVHPQFNTQQAHTGRMSITKPAMQTFKKRDPRLRGCFVARVGWVLVGADYKGQENRIAAAYSRDKAMLRIVREDLSQHVVTAQMIFGAKYVDKTTVMNTITGKTYYDAAKTLDFAQQYGAGPARIGDTLGYPSKLVTDDNGNTRRRAHPRAYRMWEAWREAYAGLVTWSENLAHKSVIVNPWGRRIPADHWRGYANANYAIQSTGRDVLGDAIVALEDAGWAERIWMLVHDEIVLEVPEDEAEDAMKVLKDCMTHQIKDIPLPVDVKIIGTRWGASEDD